ncbi:MAG TPA: hypothetical protein PKA64_20130, partial [Myxococcota bacterium]|nr:hypothetical protein [Myxococcota bacterium]
VVAPAVEDLAPPTPPCEGDADDPAAWWSCVDDRLVLSGEQTWTCEGRTRQTVTWEEATDLPCAPPTGR